MEGLSSVWADSSTIILSPSSTPTESSPMSTTEDPIQRHLSAIIGVPIGVGLSIILIGSCVLWLFLTSYMKYRAEERELREHPTNTTNLPATTRKHQSNQHSTEPNSDSGDDVSSLPGSPLSTASPPPPAAGDSGDGVPSLPGSPSSTASPPPAAGDVSDSKL